MAQVADWLVGASADHLQTGAMVGHWQTELCHGLLTDWALVTSGHLQVEQRELSRYLALAADRFTIGNCWLVLGELLSGQ